MNKAASTVFYHLWSCLEAQSSISWQIQHVKKGEQKGGGHSHSPCMASIWHPQSRKVKEWPLLFKKGDSMNKQKWQLYMK